MPTNSLTDSKCKAAKPADKPYKLFDGGGLYLYVSTTGARTWRVSYRLSGKEQTKSFGPYPDVSLGEARAKRDALKAELRNGADPMAERRAKRAGVTFSEACSEYWAGRKDLSPSYIQNATRALEMHLSGIANSNISAITRDMLLAELVRMDAKGLHSYVRKTRMWSGQVFGWAVERGIATINPAALINPEKAFGKTAVQNFAALEPREMPEFMQRLALERDIQSVLACRLLALTWVRTNELRMMQWSEIADDTWIIPAGKMKRRLDHVVPLSAQALSVLDEMRARECGSKYVFHQDRRLDRPMSENAILHLIRRIGFYGRMTGHGFRSVGSTWANESAYSPDAIERQLAHVPENKIRAVYNRAEYLPERRKMLQDWADWLDSIK